MSNTALQYDNAVAGCRRIFAAKLEDYGASWRLMRPSSVTDQLMIKANRIRCIEVKGQTMVSEGIRPEFVAIVNYGIVGVIQLRLGFANCKDISTEGALKLYDETITEIRNLMLAKNHDYDEAWRKMRVSSLTDIILTKLLRIKEIEDHQGVTSVSEGIDSNYMDIVNYAVFALIRLDEK